MGWDEQRFAELERRVFATLKGEYVIVDLPFFRFLYGPGDGIEQTCIKEFQNLVMRIKAKGFSAECIYLSRLLIESLWDLDLLSEEVLKRESLDRETFDLDLRNNLPQEISKRLIDHLKDRDRKHCAVLLRIGSLFPFVRASHILQKIDSVINCVLVIPYPGNKEGEMLWHKSKEGNTYYYRWQTV